MEGTPLPSPLAAHIAAAPRRHDNGRPLWQGPCGAGPLGGITQSMLVRFLSCRERFRLKYVLGLEPHDRWNHRIGYGHMWHECEQSHAARLDYRRNLTNHAIAQAERYPMQREEIEKWWNVCLVQFPEYVKYWSEHPDVLNRTPLLQEQVFNVPYTLPSGRVVRLRGKWDSVDLIADPDQPQSIYLQENKTKGDVDKMQIERQLKFDLQTMMYLIALCIEQKRRAVTPSEVLSGRTPVQSLYEMTCPILGVRYNVVRRPLSGGVGSIKPHAAKATKTKMTPAETPEQFYERLRRDYLAADPDHWFFRVRAEISARDVQVFRETCLDPLLETLCYWYEQITGFAGYGARGTEAMGVFPPMNYRTPFGVYSSLEEGGATEYDAYLETGSEVGLRRVETLFPELQ